MDARTRIEVSSLRRKAAGLEQLADEHEARSLGLFGFGSSYTLQATTEAEEKRAEARRLRGRADALERQHAVNRK